MREPINSKESSEGPPPEASAAEAESSEEWEAETPGGCAGLERDWEELPACDDETKVVLLPVNPYLVHVYWGIAARDLKEIGRVFSRLGPRAQPVLRFCDVTQASNEGTNPQYWHEVEIALGAGNWYVHLESPAKSYYIDLGLRIAGGGFHRLARSNVAETPRAGPSDKVEESYLLVKGDYPPLETVGEERFGASRSVSTTGERQGGEAKGSELGAGSPSGPEPSGEGLRSGPSYSEAQGGEAEGPEEGAGSPSGFTFLDDGSPTSPTYGEPAEIEPELTGLSQQGEWEPHGVTPQASGTGEPQPSGEEAVDLTDLSERSFRAGLSSGQKSS